MSAATDQDPAARLRELGAIVVEDIIGAGDARALAGNVGRQTLANWREGRNLKGAGPFPEPFRKVSGVELFDRREVLQWIKRHK